MEVQIVGVSRVETNARHIHTEPYISENYRSIQMTREENLEMVHPIILVAVLMGLVEVEARIPSKGVTEDPLFVKVTPEAGQRQNII